MAKNKVTFGEPAGSSKSEFSSRMISSYSDDRKSSGNREADLVSVSDESEEDSEEDEEEDEEGEELTPALDAAILRTLAKIKSKGEGLYSQTNVLEEELKTLSETIPNLDSLVARSRSTGKPLTLLEHQRNALLEGRIPGIDDSNEDAGPADLPETIIPLDKVDEERKLRAEVTRAFHEAIPKETAEAAEVDAEQDDLLVKKEATQGENDESSEAYRKFLLQQGGGEEEVRKALGISAADQVDQPSALAYLGSDVNAVSGPDPRDHADIEAKESKKRTRTKKDDDEFLLNYILNRGWIDKSEEDPMAQPKNRKSKSKNGDDGFQNAVAGPSSHPWGDLEAEDDFDDKADEFETTYNFRFEEPGAGNIVTHPRNIASTVRREDESRKSARQERRERKKLEKEAREEETKRLKGKKRREIEHRMEQLRKELGDKALDGIDLDGEWDEAKWDQQMQGLYGDDDQDEEKPSWDDDEIDIEYAEDNVEEPSGDMDDEGPINMDADFVGIPDDSKKKKKNKKEKRKRAHDDDGGDIDATLDQEADLPPEVKKQKLKETLEEYRNLDHEDMIGDMPTRFKYAKTAPATFGLSPVEILLATDTELNSFMGMKHYAPYRSGRSGAGGRERYQKLRELKSRISRRRWGEDFDATTSKSDKPAQDSDDRKRDSGWGPKSSSSGGLDKKSKKRKGKKERSRAAAAASATAATPTSEAAA